MSRSLEAAADVEDAAGAALGIGPGDIDALQGTESPRAGSQFDGGDVFAEQRELCFFSPVADPIGAQEKIANVPVVGAFEAARRCGRRVADVDTAPFADAHTVIREFLAE